MRVHEFTLVLRTIPSEAKVDRFHGICNDATVVVLGGIPQARFHRAANSLEDAIRSALVDARAGKMKVERVEMEPRAVLQAS